MDKFSVKVKNETFDIYEHTIKKGLASKKGQTYWRPVEDAATEENAELFVMKLTSAFGFKAVVSNLISPRLAAYSNMLTKEAEKEAYIVAGRKDGKGQLIEEKDENGDTVNIIEDEEKWEETFVESYSKMFSEMSARGESISALTEKLNELVMAFAIETDDAKSEELGKQIKLTKLTIEAKKERKPEEKAEDKNNNAAPKQPVNA